MGSPNIDVKTLVVFFLIVGTILGGLFATIVFYLLTWFS